MKRNMSFLVLLLAPAFGFCQVTVSAKAGANVDFFKDLNYYPLSTNGKLAHHPKPGLELGTAFNFKLKNLLYLDAELLYNKRAYRIVESYPPGQSAFRNDKDFQVNWHYIDLPVLLKAKIHKNLFVELGPSLSYLLSSRFKINTISGRMPVVGSQAKYYSRFDAAINTGAGYAFKRTEIGARYSHGVTTMKVKTNTKTPSLTTYRCCPPAATATCTCMLHTGYKTWFFEPHRSLEM